MPADDFDPKKIAVEAYLEQVKVLTALATTLLISPNVLTALTSTNSPTDQNVFAAKPYLAIALLTTNASFLAAIILTYLIYSSVVGAIHNGEFNVHRPATRIFSILQFVAIIVGSTALLILLQGIAS